MQKVDKNQIPNVVPIMNNVSGTYKIPYVNYPELLKTNMFLDLADTSFPNDRSKDKLSINEATLLAYAVTMGWTSGSTPTDLLPNAIRLNLPNNGTTWTLSDGGVQQDCSSATGTYQAAGKQITDDGIVGYRYSAYNNTWELYLSTNDSGQNGAGKCGLYIDGSMIAWAEYNGSWAVGDIENGVDGVFYGVRTIGGVVDLVKVIGSTVTVLHTFGSKPTNRFIAYFTNAPVAIRSLQTIGATANP